MDTHHSLTPHMAYVKNIAVIVPLSCFIFLPCFEGAGWATGRASDVQKCSSDSFENPA